VRLIRPRLLLEATTSRPLAWKAVVAFIVAEIALSGAAQLPNSPYSAAGQAIGNQTTSAIRSNMNIPPNGAVVLGLWCIGRFGNLPGDAVT
jgi:hypothetical protein